MTGEQQTVAVLGVGGMGHGMAASARRAGIPTVVWNRSPRPTEDLADLGAEVVGSAAEAAGRAGIVITMVTDADAVAAVAVEAGMLDALPPGAIWAQMSTIGVAGTERLAALVRERRPDVVFLDAPVSGSRGPAEAGKLLILASGPDDARPRVTTLFDAIGQRTIWVGPAGRGSRLKLVNNILLALINEGIAESIALAHAVGLDPATVVAAMDGSPLVSQWMSGKLRRIARDDYSPEFPLALALKDVRLALDAVEGDRFAVGSALADEWQRIADQGLADQDLTIVTRALTP